MCPGFDNKISKQIYMVIKRTEINMVSQKKHTQKNKNNQEQICREWERDYTKSKGEKN